MFVNNFLAPIQLRLSPNFVSHTLGHREEVMTFWKFKIKGQGWLGLWEVCAQLSPSSYKVKMFLSIVQLC